MSSYFEKLAVVSDVLNLKNVEADGALMISETASYRAAAGFLANHVVGLAVVTDAESNVVGVVSERDIVTCIAVHGVDAFGLVVRDFMTRDILVCSPHDRLKAIASKMAQSEVRHIVVAAGDCCVGVVSARDILFFAGES